MHNDIVNLIVPFLVMAFVLICLLAVFYCARLEGIANTECSEQCKPFVYRRMNECYCLDAEGNYNLSHPKESEVISECK